MKGITFITLTVAVGLGVSAAYSLAGMDEMPRRIAVIQGESVPLPPRDAATEADRLCREDDGGVGYDECFKYVKSGG